jgi:hypothetical protein
MEKENQIKKAAEELASKAAQEMALEAQKRGSHSTFSGHVDHKGDAYVRKEKPDGEIVLYPALGK